MYEGRLHFANSALRIYGRVPIHQDGSATGEIEIVGRALSAATIFDDLVMDWEGNAWVATHPNAVTQITSQGKQRNFTGGEVEMHNPTWVAWGRGSRWKRRRHCMSRLTVCQRRVSLSERRLFLSILA